jgi:hypothetical protein
VEATETLIRFTDADGAVVPQRLPEGARTPIEDAVDACPACGAFAWVRIRATVACERCGHVAGPVLETGHGGTSMRLGSRGDLDEVGGRPSPGTKCLVSTTRARSRWLGPSRRHRDIVRERDRRDAAQLACVCMDRQTWRDT